MDPKIHYARQYFCILAPELFVHHIVTERLGRFFTKTPTLGLLNLSALE